MTTNINSKFHIYNKGIRIIKSCETEEHFCVARSWMRRAKPLLGDGFAEQLMARLLVKRWEAFKHEKVSTL